MIKMLVPDRLHMIVTCGTNIHQSINTYNNASGLTYFAHLLPSNCGAILQHNETFFQITFCAKGRTIISNYHLYIIYVVLWTWNERYNH